MAPNNTFSYDASGNMITRTDSTGTYTQAYDVENRLTSVSENGIESTATTTFAYDANGQRTTTTNPDGTLTLYPFPATEQSYPAAQNDLFPENAANWNLENGTWNWNASQFYISSSNSNNAVTTHNTATLGNSGVIAASIRANNNKNGYLVFDYQDATTYKYIGLDAQTDKWVFGQRVSNANSDLYIVNETIANAQWYDVKILLNGNTAKLYVNGTFKAQYSYPATFSGGKVGFRAVNANTYFDNFLVSTAETSRTTYTLGGQAIATHVTGDPTPTNNGLFYIFSDHLGSTSVLATSSGNQVPGSKAAYYPFGSPRTAPTQTITDRNFTGQKENLELGLLYYNARYYLPGSGRFLTPDTLIPNPQSSQSYNRYSYTLNAPLTFVDPTGHCEEGSYGDDYEDYDCLAFAQQLSYLTGLSFKQLSIYDWGNLTLRQLHKIWAHFTEAMQQRLNEKYGIREDGSPYVPFGSNAEGNTVIPHTQAELIAMMTIGYKAVTTIIDNFHFDQNNQVECSCNSLVGAYFNFQDDIYPNMPDNGGYATHFDFYDTPLPDRTPNAVLFTSNPESIPLHGALLVTLAPTPLDSILLQVDGNLTASGIFYNTIGSSPHNVPPLKIPYFLYLKNQTGIPQ